MNFMIMCFLMILPPIPGKISPELDRILDQTAPFEKITVIVHMNTEYPFEQMAGFPSAERAAVMKDITLNSQRNIIEYISSLPAEKAVMGGQYWIFNGFHLKATRDVIENLAGRDDVWFICENSVVQLPPNELGGPYPAVAEWNIQKVMADSCWQAGYSGDSIFIGILDTGCDFNHPALQGKWSGRWYDFVNGQSAPYDDHGHGTFASGIVCGGDGLGTFVNDIGVAPGAKLVVAKVFDQNGGATYAALDSAMQWMADLRADSGVAIKAVTNSWGNSSYTDLHFWNICLTWKTLNMLGIFSAGSSGPGSATINVPASFPLVMASGATDNSDVIASFSSRGPAPNQSPWNDIIYWYRPDWGLIKPDLVAPGVSIRSSYNNNGYVVMNGTSWSNPHIAGAVAIMTEVDSTLGITEIYNFLLDNADWPTGGGTRPNNTYGWGRLNIWRTLQAITGIEETGSLTDVRLSLTVYPSISRGNVQIAFHASKGQRAENTELKIYDISGRLVKSFSSLVPRPSSFVAWLGDDANDLPVPAGVYLVELTCGTSQLTKKAVLLR